MGDYQTRQGNDGLNILNVPTVWHKRRLSQDDHGGNKEDAVAETEPEATQCTRHFDEEVGELKSLDKVSR